jgi:hypothetical protein
MSAGTCSIVRGLQVSSVAHQDASHRILTGVAADSAPDVAAIASAIHGADLAAPYLILGRTAYSGPYGSLGGAHRLGQPDRHAPEPELLRCRRSAGRCCPTSRATPRRR